MIQYGNATDLTRPLTKLSRAVKFPPNQCDQLNHSIRVALLVPFAFCAITNLVDRPALKRPILICSVEGPVVCLSIRRRPSDSRSVPPPPD